MSTNAPITTRTLPILDPADLRIGRVAAILDHPGLAGPFLVERRLRGQRDVYIVTFNHTGLVLGHSGLFLIEPQVLSAEWLAEAAYHTWESALTWLELWIPHVTEYIAVPGTTNVVQVRKAIA